MPCNGEWVDIDDEDEVHDDDKFTLRVGSPNLGWECPRCGMCLAPTTPSCDRCAPVYFKPYQPFHPFQPYPYPYTPTPVVPEWPNPHIWWGGSGDVSVGTTTLRIPPSNAELRFGDEDDQ